MSNLTHVQHAKFKSVEQYEIVDTGWRTDGLFAVILGAEKSALLESGDALDYAGMIARRRRYGIVVAMEQVEPGTGKYPFQRVFCFSRS